MTEPDMTPLYDALAAFQDDMPTVPKTRVGRGYGDRDEYLYADLADITAAARPVLSKHGLLYTTTTGVRDDGAAVVTGHLVHVDTGLGIDATIPLHGRHPQELGSALTYARRYLLGCLTGLVTDEDDDGQAAAPRRGGRPAAVEAVVNPEQRMDALRTDLAKAETLDALRAVYADHELGSAPEDVRQMYHDRVLAVRTEAMPR